MLDCPSADSAKRERIGRDEDRPATRYRAAGLTGLPHGLGRRSASSGASANRAASRPARSRGVCSRAEPRPGPGAIRPVARPRCAQASVASASVPAARAPRAHPTTSPRPRRRTPGPPAARLLDRHSSSAMAQHEPCPRRFPADTASRGLGHGHFCRGDDPLGRGGRGSKDQQDGGDSTAWLNSSIKGPHSSPTIDAGSGSAYTRAPPGVRRSALR